MRRLLLLILLLSDAGHSISYSTQVESVELILQSCTSIDRGQLGLDQVVVDLRDEAMRTEKVEVGVHATE